MIDFDQVTRDPGQPNRLLPLNDSGDHLHPNDAGYQAMGEAVPLRLFKKKVRARRERPTAAASSTGSRRMAGTLAPVRRRPLPRQHPSTFEFRVMR